jgi:16S rRNA (cytosine1402-N4)-methyltransferase
MIATMAMPKHIPVLTEEVILGLNVQPGKQYIDCTLGLGGHARNILEKCYPGGKLLGIDADQQAISVARDRLSAFSDSIVLVNDNFKNLENICLANEYIPVDGILFDLGISSMQLDTPQRGFSFKNDAQLDMRFSSSQELTATDIINILSEEKLAQLLWEYGEERKSRQIAKLIVQNRPIASTSQLSQIVGKVISSRDQRIHPATRTFLALRIAVNNELENLELTLKQTINCLGSKGRLVVISYHSLEDRIVKLFMKRETTGCICSKEIPLCNCKHGASFRYISKKVIIPSFEEIQNNPRSRSAKLRVVERL